MLLAFINDNCVAADGLIGVNPTPAAIVRQMNLVAKSYEPFGKVDLLDFRDLSPLFARIFAFDNKHYFIYKAIDNPNKIGFLSRRQYYALKMYKESLHRQGTGGSTFSRLVEAFLSKNGTMASPYKLIKRAFKENAENLRFMSKFFRLLPDKKTTRNEDKLIRLCDAMMQLENGIEIKDSTVQECYDLDFHGSHIEGSSERCATNSCMHGKKVGRFYDSFGAHGKMVYYRGKPVGRFLMWDLSDGKKYIDRLYVRGEYMNEALAKIDELYDDKQYIKYPALRQNNAPLYLIEMSHPEVLDEEVPDTPYIDTFGNLIKHSLSGKYYLCNKNVLNPKLNGKYKYIGGMRNLGTPHRMKSCEACHTVFWTGDNVSGAAINSNRHKLYCKGYLPRTKELQDYLIIFRKYVSLLNLEEQNATTESTESTEDVLVF